MRTWFDNRSNTNKEMMQLLKAYKEIINFNAICSLTNPDEHGNLDADSPEWISNLKISAADLDEFIKRLSSLMHELRPEFEASSDESK